MIAIALSVRAQEGSRYDRFSSLVKGVLIPLVGVFGLTWDTDLVGSKEGRARAREGEGSGKLRAHLCTRVYTVVYTWVYSSVHTCILIPPR